LPAKVFQFTMGRESREKLVLKVGPSWIGDCCRLDWTADCSWKFVNFTKLKLSYFHFLPDANLLEYAGKYAAFFFLDVQLSRAEILFCPFNRTPKPQMQLEFCVAWIFLALCKLFRYLLWVGRVKCAAPREIMILYLLTFPQADAKPRPASKMKERKRGN